MKKWCKTFCVMSNPLNCYNRLKGKPLLSNIIAENTNFCSDEILSLSILIPKNMKVTFKMMKNTWKSLGNPWRNPGILLVRKSRRLDHFVLDTLLFQFGS